MAKTIKIEARTMLFNAAVEWLKKKDKNLTNALIAKQLDIPNVSTLSEIKSLRQNIQPDKWDMFKKIYPESIKGISEFTDNSVPHETIMADDEQSYLATRRQLKSSEKTNTLMFYEIGAHAGTHHAAEILPVRKSEGVLRISDLFKGSEFAIRISGNSMIPSYPPGAIIGIREIPDKMIQPGSVYVVEKESDLWIKRVFYKDNKQSTGVFVLASDNEMKYEKGPMEGHYHFPPFEIEIDKVRRLFKVTGLYKANELTVINA